MDDSGTISIAMEFCEGGSLDGVYREVKNRGGRTGEKVLGKVADGVLNGLTYLHKQKIIHRGVLQLYPRSLLFVSRFANGREHNQISNLPISFFVATVR